MLMRVALCFTLLICSMSARACLAPISHDELISQASVIVIGKLSDKKEGEKNIATATLTVSKVLKGDAGLKSLTLTFMAKPETTASWSYTGTEEGIWFLARATASDKSFTYSTFHPSCLVRTDATDAESRKAVDELIEKVVKQVAAPKQPVSNQK